MQIQKLDRRKTPFFSQFGNDFLYAPEKIEALKVPVYSSQKVAAQCSEKKKEFSTTQRQRIQNYFQSRYQGIANEAQQVNITALSDENCFTVTTGHQLNLLGGTLFSLYKILHVIRLSEELNKNHPDCHFVPVFWMASEDHDFEEINELHLFRKTLKWNTAQSGPVGRFKTENWKEFIDEVRSFFQNHPDSEIHALLDLYEDGRNLGEVSWKLINDLFSRYGLLVLDADHQELKHSFSGIMKREIEERFCEQAVLKSNEKIEAAGYKTQVFVRPINLFWMGPQKRERIVPISTHEFESTGGKVFSKTELLNILEEHPENISPNALLRPIYQETILPNIAYIGGTGELAYWMQLPQVFEELGMTMPLLAVRQSIQLIDENSSKKMDKLDLSLEDFMLPSEELKQLYLGRLNLQEADLSGLKIGFEELKKELLNTVLKEAPQLDKYAQSEVTKLDKQLEGIEQKLNKANRQQYDQSIAQLLDLQSRLFPNKGLQERYDHFLNYTPTGNFREFIHTLYQLSDPDEKNLIISDLSSVS
ncbi:MAG: bacillithiol biosynthesis cysteine-adding enzyme BshC [Bacteroidetes bacterium]|nr:MAG: bacillithiol biosynthesis cysteine-adding enzyme BshC [Bacteroidota bacterium]